MGIFLISWVWEVIFVPNSKNSNQYKKIKRRHFRHFKNWCTWLGIRVGLFTPDRAFEEVCKTRITQLRQPCLKLVELVMEEIRQILKPIISKVGIWVCTVKHACQNVCVCFVSPWSSGTRPRKIVYLLKYVIIWTLKNDWDSLEYFSTK